MVALRFFLTIAIDLDIVSFATMNRALSFRVSSLEVSFALDIAIVVYSAVPIPLYTLLIPVAISMTSCVTIWLLIRSISYPAALSARMMVFILVRFLRVLFHPRIVRWVKRLLRPLVSMIGTLGLPKLVIIFLILH